jgi:sulfur relay (sulfurtransferase) complex TusBCD TusD component (DsrE family)
MRITVIVQTDPSKYQDFEATYEVVTAALKKGHEVKIFLYDESVVAASKDLKTTGKKGPNEMMKELIQEGVEVTTCSACCIFRGIAKEMLVEGSQMGGLPDLAKMTDWADRILNFGN